MTQPIPLDNFRRRESNPDEIQRLMGARHQYVERHYYALEAGRHVRRMFDAILAQRVPFEDAQDAVRQIAYLAAEYDFIERGDALPVGATVHAKNCDCKTAHLAARDGRCCE